MKGIDFAIDAILIAIIAAGFQVSTLRSEIKQQRADIERLSKFVDAQAAALNSCQKVVSDLTDSVIHDNWLEMFGSVGDLTTQMGLCDDAVEHFNQINSANNP